MNYVVQRACGQKLADIFDLYIRQPGMGPVVRPALIYTDDGQEFNQSSGVAKWNGLDGAAVLRLAGRLGIWDNRSVEPVRLWDLVTRTTDNIAAAAAAGWGVVFSNNSRNTWTRSTGYRRLSLEMFGHGGNYSTVFLNEPAPLPPARLGLTGATTGTWPAEAGLLKGGTSKEAGRAAPGGVLLPAAVLPHGFPPVASRWTTEPRCTAAP